MNEIDGKEGREGRERLENVHLGWGKDIEEGGKSRKKLSESDERQEFGLPGLSDRYTKRIDETGTFP